MSEKEKKIISDEEVQASERRANRLKEIHKELEDNKDSELAKMLAEIEAKNKK